MTKHNISRLVDLLCKSDQKSSNLRLAYMYSSNNSDTGSKVVGVEFDEGGQCSLAAISGLGSAARQIRP